jgi:RNA methyltransferase, TrmH family
MMPLTKSNPQIQRLRRLMGRRSSRSEEGVFVLESPKTLDEALDAAWPIECIYVLDGADHPVLYRAADEGIPIVLIDQGALDSVSDTVSPQPILATARLIGSALDSLRSPLQAGGFVIVGVEIQDPGNVGTMIRTAEAAGASGIVFTKGSADVTNPKVVRAAAGSLFYLPIVVDVDPSELLSQLHDWGVVSWASAMLGEGAVPYDRADLRGGCALFMGNEANGLSDLVLSASSRSITIPMAGDTESLNVGIAAGVLAFEAARQRRI